MARPPTEEEKRQAEKELELTGDAKYKDRNKKVKPTSPSKHKGDDNWENLGSGGYRKRTHGEARQPDSKDEKPRRGGLQQDVQEDVNLSQFIKNVTEKNYSEANKYLHAALEQKMKGRIEVLAKKIGF